MDIPENGHWTIFDKAKANRVDRTDGKSKERRSALAYLQPLQIIPTFNAPLLLATFTSPVVSELAMTDGCPSMFVICYPSVNSRMTLYSRKPKWKTPVVILVVLCLVEKTSGFF